MGISTKINAAPPIEYGASYRSTTALLANTPEVVFTPAANINGAILHSAQFYSESSTGGGNAAFLAKVSAPLTSVDGDAILTGSSGAIGTTRIIAGGLNRGVRIPAGKGLYFISTSAEAVANRGALYTLL